MLNSLNTGYRRRVTLKVLDLNTRFMDSGICGTCPYSGTTREATVDPFLQVLHGIPDCRDNFKVITFQCRDPFLRFINEPVHLSPGDGPCSRQVGPQQPPRCQEIKGPINVAIQRNVAGSGVYLSGPGKDKGCKQEQTKR